jgi:hypothetical protein
VLGIGVSSALDNKILRYKPNLGSNLKMNFFGHFHFFHMVFVLGYGMQSGSRRHRQVLADDRLKLVKVQGVLSFSLSHSCGFGGVSSGLMR